MQFLLEYIYVRLFVLLVKGAVHPTMNIQSLSTHPCAGGRSGEVF